MTKRIARLHPRSRLAPAGITITPSAVLGRFRPERSGIKQVILTIDGIAYATAPTQALADGTELGFELPIPSVVLGGALDVLAAETGRSVLERDCDLTASRGLRWLGWSLRGRRIKGRFRFEGPAAPTGDGPIPVEFRAGTELYGRCFAQVERDEQGERTYVFSGEISRLPARGETVEVSPSIGGIYLGERLPVSASAFAYLGYTDGADSPRAEGWAIDLEHPHRRVTVELRINGHTVATAVANKFREDVKKQGLSDGRAGFLIPFPHSVPLDRPVQVEVLVAGTGLNLSNSPYVKPASPPYVGYFDGMDGAYAGGWVVDMHRPGQPVRVDAICNDAVVGSGLANLYRVDVESAGLPTARCGFQFLLDRPLNELVGRDIAIVVSGTDQMLPGSPRQVMQNRNITRFLARAAEIPAAALPRLIRRMTYRTRAVGISIIMPVFDPKPAWLAEALDSVRAQWSGNWELICVDDGSREPEIGALLDRYAAADARIRVLRASANMGIARAINFGLRAARGNYVAFMDHDDTIEPDAVYRLADAAIATGADLVYSDEVLTGPDIGGVIQVRARPAFSHDFYLSHPYFVHMVCVRTELARALAGYDESLPISADVDFVLRVIERAGTVAHVPRVLYRWRTHTGSTGHAKQAEVTATTKAALARHLARLGRNATVSDGLGFNQFRIDWPDDGGEVLIVVPTKDRVDLLEPCIASVERTCADANYRLVVIDHESRDPATVRYLASLAGRHTVLPYEGAFNYARMNNVAVARHGGAARYVLLLNNDVEAIAPGWLPRLRSLAGRKEVGAVGPLLLYDNDRVQHAGVLVGFSGAADHAMRLVSAYCGDGGREPGYNCNLTVVRDYSAVTAACMMMRREVFDELGGLDENFVVGFNDTDLCLRAGAAGYKVLYDGHTVLYHHESQTRQAGKDAKHPEDDDRLRTRWTRYFEQGDPFYSPLLTPRGTDHILRSDDGCRKRMRVRAMTLRPQPAEPAGKRVPGRGRRRPAP